MAIDYSSHSEVLTLLGKDQEPERDNREKVRESHYFLEKRDGQWEPDIIKNMSGRPRYTFDMCNPIVDQICGEMEQSDFAIKVSPAGGDATMDLAQTYDGLIRNIENMSNASDVYNAGSRDMVAGGIGGWEVVQDWADADSFDQDLLIRPISNFEDTVWFDSGAQLQTMSDARHVFVLKRLTKSEYESKYPKGSKIGIGSDQSYDAYQFKPDLITVGRILYKKKVSKELVLMTDGSVYEDDDSFKSVADELREQGITEKARRSRDSYMVHSRIFDGGGWLNEDQPTVFRHLPVIPVYANFRISDSKVIYRGSIDKLMDHQRVYNYAKSREVEEVALSPRAKYWMTKEQAKGHTDQLQTMNVNSDPVQFYSYDDRVGGPPVQIGGAQINQGLLAVSSSMVDSLQRSAGLFGINQGDADQVMSGVAIQSLQNKGDNGTIKYFKPREIAVCQTAKVLISAIPSVYDTPRQVRLLNEDGSQEMVTINETIFDHEQGKMVELNDLSQGQYDVVCEVGPAFKNRQQESVRALTDLIAVVPQLGEISADILLKNINAPSVDKAAERVRASLVRSGAVPESQLTKEEKLEIQQAQALAQSQPQEPTAEDKIADAEIARVQAETADVQARATLKQEELRIKEQANLIKAQENANSSDLAVSKAASDEANNTAKNELAELTLLLKQQSQQMAQQQAMIEANIKGQAQVVDNLNTQAKTLETLRSAMGVDAIVGPAVAEAYQEQAEIVLDEQEGAEQDLPRQ